MASEKPSTQGLQLVTSGSNTVHDVLSSTKTIVIQRINNGFGFTLRHFVVYPPEVIRTNSQGSAVNGIEHGGPNKPKPVDTVFVRQVAPGGPADKAGLSSGDQIVSVNGNQVLNRTYSQVIELIQKSRDQVALGIIPKEECVLEMVSPTLTVTSTVKATPPPTKPKPTRPRSTESPSPSPGKVTSTVTIAPMPSPDAPWQNTSVTLKLADRSTDTTVPRDNEIHVTRRGSVDRSAQEHRNFVIAPQNGDTNNKNKHKQLSSSEQQATSPMDGTFFFAATDYTGKPKALHFQRGATTGDKVMVIDDPKTKAGRSRSLPAVEMESFRGWQENRRHQYSTLTQQNGPKSSDQSSLHIDIGERIRRDSSSSSIIPQFNLSAPRTVASDSPSTVNISTNSEFSSRQPVAREPSHQRMSGEESTSYLVRTIASHMNQERMVNLKSSIMEATLLESKPDRKYSDTSDGGTQRNNDEPQPAMIPRKSDSNEQLTYSNQVYHARTHDGPSFQFANNSGHEGRDLRMETSIADGNTSPELSSISPRQRRTSYLMATGSTPKSLTGKTWSSQGDIKKKKPTLSSALSSSFITPMMVHVSSGTELCQEGPKEGEFLENDEIFMEGEREDESVPRLGRRVSYVMATSTPSSPRRITLEGMREEEEDQTPGSVEVSKEGLLWKKVAAAGGGKRSSARSWKPVYTVLRGHVMYFHKVKETSHQADGAEESQPISIKSSIVDIAYDYTKRKNVFRMSTFNGSEFLFQAEDHESMMSWIAAIQANNNPDEDESGVSSQGLIIRRMRSVEQETAGSNTQTPPVHKLTPPTGAKMSNFSNLKKSLSFKNISGSQKGDGSKNHQWHKGHKKRKKPPPPVTNFTAGHSIGVPLEMCPCSKLNKFVPILVEHCCEVVDKKGIETVGVYRVPGNSAAVGALQEELNEKGADNINFQDEKWHDVNNITSLLKQFLRKLPEGLVTADLYEGFIEANRKDDPVERMGALKMLINELPEHNYETLRFLLCHLKNVADNVDTNKMEARNLAIVFGPTLVRTGEDTMMSMVKDMSDQCRIVETILTHNEWFFESSEGDDVPPSKPPMGLMDSPPEQFISLSVLSSLGQAAGNFNEDGNMKSKPPSPGHLTLHIPKFRSKQKSESHDTTPTEVSPPSGNSSPTNERNRPVLKITTAGSCPGSPTQERLPTKLSGRRGGELSSASTGSMSSVAEIIDADSKGRGTSSLRAYSYARPPPPSYRKTGPKRPNSPNTEQDSVQVSATFGLMPPEPSEPAKVDSDHGMDVDHGGHPKPSFASLSEETRLRLLKVSLQQKAAEKKRLLDSPTSPHASVFPDVNGEVTVPHRLHEHDASDSTEHLSSMSTSTSSSPSSSKNASRESLPEAEVHKTLPNPVAKATSWERRGSTGRVVTPSTIATDKHVATPSTTMVPPSATAPNAHVSTPATTTSVVTSHVTTSSSSTPQLSEVVNKMQSSETVLNIIQGKGVTTSGSEATRRPMSSDIRARRNTAEGLRLQQQSESSDSSSDEEANLKLSMSKTFDEKLRLLLDLDYQFKGQKKAEEAVSASSSHLRSSTESLEDIRGSSNSLATSAPDRRPSFDRSVTQPRRASVERSHFIIQNKQPEITKTNTNTKTTIQIQHDKQPGLIPQSKNTTDKRPVSSRDTTKTDLNVDKSVLMRRSEGAYSGDNQAATAQSKIGRVHTTTPVALKEFKITGSNFRKEPVVKKAPSKARVATPPSSVTSRQHLQRHDSPYIKSKTESTFVKPQTETTSILISPRSSLSSPRGSISDSSPRNSSSESSPRSSRTEMSINLSGGQQKSQATRKPSKYAAMAARSHVPPKVMGRETVSKSKTYPHRDPHRDILPSKSAFKETVPQKHVTKMESNAKHIAELLEEMRYIKMSRQRSDISGQAQRGAAQRAAQARTRRRSLGDENQELISMTVTANQERNHREGAVEGPPQVSRESGNRRATDGPPQASHESGNRRATDGPPHASRESGNRRAMERSPQASRESSNRSATEGPSQASRESGNRRVMKGAPQASRESGNRRATEGPPQASRDSGNRRRPEERSHERRPGTSEHRTTGKPKR